VPHAWAGTRSGGPDLVVTDLKLPGVDCLAVARHAHGHVPLILITAYDSPHARSAAREGGWRPISPNRSPTLRSLMPSGQDCPRSRRLEGARNARSRGDALRTEGPLPQLLEGLGCPEAYRRARPGRRFVYAETGPGSGMGSPVLTVARAIPVPHGRPGVLVAHWSGREY